MGPGRSTYDLGLPTNRVEYEGARQNTSFGIVHELDVVQRGTHKAHSLELPMVRKASSYDTRQNLTQLGIVHESSASREGPTEPELVSTEKYGVSV